METAIAPSYQHQGLTLWFMPIQDWETAILVSVAIATEAHPTRSHLTLHLDPIEFEQRFFQLQLLAPVELQQAIDDPALKHLIGLLHTELCYPQAMNREFVWAIVTPLVVGVGRSAIET